MWRVVRQSLRDLTWCYSEEARPYRPPPRRPRPDCGLGCTLGADDLQAQGDQRALAFQAQLARGQWQEFHDFLEATTDWGLRSF